MKRFNKHNMKWFIFNNTFIFNDSIVDRYKIKHLFGLENFYKFLDLSKI
jgi:hypothetical protein